MSTLIYDGECGYCVAISKIAGLTTRLESIPYQSERAQEMLENEFDEPGFTMYFFEDDKVYWGQEAAREIAKKSFIPVLLVWPAVRFYPQLKRLFTLLTDRSNVSNPVCNSDECEINREDGGIKEIK
jgi:predicted DCC family thiol-disulfide oxidoreductase YuxK